MRRFLKKSLLFIMQRKDKLREHMQRMHNPEREAKKADRIHRTKSLKQKEPSTDFESFIFKCRLCMMGFRRRGMLVITFSPLIKYHMSLKYLAQYNKPNLLNDFSRNQCFNYLIYYRLITCQNATLRCESMRSLSWHSPSLSPTEITFVSIVIRYALDRIFRFSNLA